jgi:Mg-chelatase subunit ChlD
MKKKRDKMLSKKQIHNLIIVDESGSMEAVKEETINGFHELANKIESLSDELPDQENFISLITFNGNGIKTRLFTQPIVELVNINDQNFKPDNTTPMYDAICKSVLKLKHELYGLENYGVLVTIITDGMENSSEEFSRKETKLLIENMSEDSNWGFGLIGANIDLEETAKSLSIPLNRIIEFESNGESVNSMFKRYGKAQETFSAVFSNGGNFTDNDIPF